MAVRRIVGGEWGTIQLKEELEARRAKRPPRGEFTGKMTKNILFLLQERQLWKEEGGASRMNK